MKILIIKILLILVAFQVAGQQLTHQSQYMLNHFEINPGASGINEYLPLSC
jgi:hypothetical protein